MSSFGRMVKDALTGGDLPVSGLSLDLYSFVGGVVFVVLFS